MKSVGIDEYTHKELKKLTKVYGSDMGKFITAAIDYFKSTGINPNDRAIGYSEELKNIKKEINRLIGFQRKFEKDQLFPLFESMKKSEIQLTKCLPKQDKSVLASFDDLKKVSTVWRERHEEIETKIQGVGSKLNKLENKVDELTNMLKVVLNHGAGTYTATMGGHKTSILESYNETKK